MKKTKITIKKKNKKQKTVFLMECKNPKHQYNVNINHLVSPSNIA